ncbi:glycosyltransferase family 4 protein [Gordonia jinhuaensis]|uniref:glycosyltransferase family 4 protein n=1 Tax=Gordonia jinhuaensis TaxID=1517702 RepID=UPI0016658F10|nr:glycosyltransferase family 1 protein [Gordonia jinhuaensis]
MRVAIVAESFLPHVNGVVNSVLRVVEHLQRTGHEVIVIAPDAPGRARQAPTELGPTPVYLMPSVRVPKVSSLPVGVPSWSMRSVLADFDPDIVHLASPFVVGGAGVYAARSLGIPTVAVFQTDVAGFAASYGMGLTARAAWSWTRRVHRMADRTLAPSTESVKALRGQGIPRVHRWGRGVDANLFHPGRRDAVLHDNWSRGRLVVGFVGRLAPEKHVERLAVLADRDDVSLVIVGEGPERGRLQRLMPSAVFTGALTGEELATAYASFDVFVHAGEHETFCQAVQEALASGVAVIGPDAGGPRDLIGHCRTGYLLPVEDFSQRLGPAIDVLADDVIRAGFGAAARRSVAERTWPAICDELLDHYRTVIARAAANGRRVRDVDTHTRAG